MGNKIYKNSIFVETGEVKDSIDVNSILTANALGSCIAITVYEFKKKIGVLAHVMLPGRSLNSNASDKTKYAYDAIDKLLNFMHYYEGDIHNMTTCIVGGGNVLQREDDTICDNNINSVKQYLAERRLIVKKSSVGGIKRRSVSLDIESGRILYSVGDDKENILWKYN